MSVALEQVFEHGELIISELTRGMLLSERYTVLEKLGDGSIASVYRAEDAASGTMVALKVLDPLRGLDPVGRARFRREYEVLSQLVHPRIARCLRYERDFDLDFLVLELVDGETLGARIARGRISIDEAVRVTIAVAEGLEACHRQGILHRDLKPANIMLHPERGPVILDFGSAWFSTAANLTRTGALIGSPQYLAPDVFTTSIIDARADIYSLGAILFEMLAGRPIYSTDSIAELAELHRSSEPPSIRSLRTDVPLALAEVVARAIAPRAEDRFATTRELLDALCERRSHSVKKFEQKLWCAACSAALIIDLPFCPSCGEDVDWELTSGNYAVQLDEVPNVQECADWLEARHGAAIRLGTLPLRERLTRLPAPLIVGASQATARQLAAEARELGCEAQVVRARAIIGARLQPADASLPELAVVAIAHFGVVIGLGMLLVILGFGLELLISVPLFVALLGYALSRLYVRKALLICRTEARPRTGGRLRDEVQAHLRTLKTARGKSLASSAVARAAVLFGENLPDLGSIGYQDVADHLYRALNAAAVADAQALLLGAVSRTRLAAEIAETESKIASGDTGAIDDLAELEQERRTLAEASVAHDLAARDALEATHAISEALRIRVNPAID